MGLIKLINNYRTLGHKEFMIRWKAGIEQATPLEQTKAQVTFTRITLIGIALGFAVSVYSAKNLWWLAIIMVGAFGNTYVGYVGLKQKVKLLEQFEQPLVKEELHLEDLKGGEKNE